MLHREKDVIEQTVSSALKKLGWRTQERKTLIREATANKKISRLDYTLKIGGKLYAAEVKYSRNMDNILSTLYYRAVVRLNAFVKRRKNLHSLALFVVDGANTKQAEKLNAMFEKYTPEMAWLLIKTSGGLAYRFPDKNKKLIFHKWRTEKVAEISTIKLSFSDLELWLFKVLFFLNYKRQGNNELIKNAYQLSKVAGVSPMRANNWVRAMEQSGFIGNNKDGFLILKNIESYLSLWSGKYTWEDNRIRNFEYIQQAENVQDIIVNRIKKISKHQNKYLITGNYAAQEYQVKFSTAKTLQIYAFTDNTREIEKDIGLIPAEGKTSISIVKAKFPAAVLRGNSFSPQKYIVDYIQLYLDCYHLPDRGYEQAGEIKRILILK